MSIETPTRSQRQNAVAKRDTLNDIPDDCIISMREFAGLAGVSYATACRLRYLGKLPVIRLSERRIGLRMRAVRAWLAEREATADA